MRYIINYFKQYIKSILVLILGILIFLTIFALNQLPLASVGYACLLLVFFLCIFFTIDFYFYFRKIRKLEMIKENFPYNIDQLPAPTAISEALYQDIIQRFHKEFTQYKQKIQTESNAMLDYYTLWAHQIKTPISAMRLILQTQELLNNNNTAENSDNPDDYAYSDITLNKDFAEEIFKIEQYVDMVLNYQRIHSASSDFVIKRHSLDTLLRQSIRKFSKLFIRKKISLDYTPAALEILTDEKWFCFCIEQFLSNALKYTAAGKISICTRDSKLYICDSGIGICPEDLPRIFEKGYTGYNGRADKKSTGIGLYLCKEICDKLNHKISITSTLKIGTTICIDLSFEHVEIE